MKKPLMLRRVAPLLAGLGVFSFPPVPIHAASPKIDTSHLLVPGKQVGHLFVGKSGNNGLATLPKATAEDAAMSQTRQVWTSDNGKQTLFLHTVSNGALNVKPYDGVTITEIRVTAPYFRTIGGLHTGTTRREIQKQFPHLRRDKTPNESTIYGDAAKGIAFEFGKATAEAKCIGITVFVPSVPDKPASGHVIRGSDVARLLRDSSNNEAL